jgi:cell division septal protein FtsQ
MHQKISKKIFIYLFIFFSLGTLSNSELQKLHLTKINSIEIIGLQEFEKNQIHQDLNSLKNLNLFSLEKKKISEVINSYEIIESFFIFKNYPSHLNIKIKKTKFLAIVKKNDLNFYIGSNGNLIKTKNYQSNLPLIFGEVEIDEFLKFKKIVDNSNFNYNDVKSLYYFKSKRWDIVTKNDLVIKLPKEELEKSFELLIKIYKKNEFKNLKLIDLRQKNQVILNG